MELTNNQEELLELTKKLEGKVRQYHDLCQKLEEYKAKKLDEDAIEYKTLLEEFKKNNSEINSINEKIAKLDKK